MEYKFESVNKLFERTIRDNWDIPSLTNYQGETLYFKDLARVIANLHDYFSLCGIKPGDKISLCGKNHINWAAAFLATMTYGAVPVPILHEFKSTSVHNLVNHSESKLLFTDEAIWQELDPDQMPDLLGVISINDLSQYLDRGHVFNNDTERSVDRSSLNYYEDKPGDVALINYTSGTSGFSKGVVLTYLSIWSNLYFAESVHSDIVPGSRLLSILPSAHMYGLMFELLFQFSRGVHIFFLNRVPSPKIIMRALADVKPNLIIAVPLVIEKIYKNVIEPQLEQPKIKYLRKYLPGFNHILMRQLRKRLVAAFGGQFSEMIIGGAAFNKEVESFFHKMRFPFTVGYGMTECGPIITYSHWYEALVGSSGKAVPNMELKIDSSDPVNVAGEILCRGANVFREYYKNPEDTAKVFTDDGWFRTGDIGVIDRNGYLFIKGRCKCMILGPSGQNIYPEELETVLNNLKYVVESLVVEENGGLTAIIFPDRTLAKKNGLDEKELCATIDSLVAKANKQFASYGRIKKIEVLESDFERTPKKSIKRYLYQKQ